MNALATLTTAVATVRGFGQAALQRFRLLWAKLVNKPD